MTTDTALALLAEQAELTIEERLGDALAEIMKIRTALVMRERHACAELCDEYAKSAKIMMLKNLDNNDKHGELRAKQEMNTCLMLAKQIRARIAK